MEGGWIGKMGRLYAATVVGTAAFTVGVFVAGYLPVGIPIGYELAMERAGNIVVCGNLILAGVGGAMGMGCWRGRRETPEAIVHGTMAAMLLGAAAIILLPAIAT